MCEEDLLVDCDNCGEVYDSSEEDIDGIGWCDKCRFNDESDDNLLIKGIFG